MRREQIDMWVVICREHNEDPVYRTLVPHPSHFAWRLAMFVYFDRGPAGIERLVVNPYGSGDLHKAFADHYTPAFEPAGLDPWQRLGRLIRERNPRRIAVNESPTFAFADGLTAWSKAQLVQALGPDLAKRLVSSERLAVGWLERRSQGELEFYPRIVALTHGIVAEAFSSAVVKPGVTTIDDLAWWVRERIAESQARDLVPADVLHRPAGVGGPASRVVQRGDLLRCDIGISYVGLTADIQQVAYVLRDGETEPPRGLRDALAKGNRLQDILAGEFKAGATGNADPASALRLARQEGLVPRIYSHPIGYDGHAAGSRVGLPDMQEGVPGMGDYPLYPTPVGPSSSASASPSPSGARRYSSRSRRMPPSPPRASRSSTAGRPRCTSFVSREGRHLVKRHATARGRQQPPIETARLRLRHLTPEDADFIVELLNEPAFIRNIGDRGVRTAEDGRAYIANGPAASYERHGFGLYAVELKETGQPIGICGLLKRDTLDDVDIGFAFLSRYWSKGYAVEAAKAVAADGRERVGLRRIVAITVPGNEPSIRVLEKIGLRFERMVRVSDSEPELKLYAVDYEPGVRISRSC